MRKIQLFIIFITIYMNASVAQSDTIFTKVFSVEELQDDLNYWRSRLEKELPILYLYKNKNEIDLKFDSIYNSIDQPMNEIAFYRILTPLTTFIQDGHNSIVLSEPALEALRNCNDLFPLNIKCIKNKFYVSSNFSTSPELLPGTEIISINNVSAEEMLSKFLSNIPQEGHNLQYIYGSLNQSFRFYYFVFYGLSEKYTIRYKNLNSLVGNCEVPGTDLITMKTKKEKRKTPHLNPYNLQMLDSMKTALLTLKTLDQTLVKTTYHKNFKKDISEYFNLIQKSNYTDLIIDLRDNTGGNPDYVKHLLLYLFNEPFEQCIECRVVKNKEAEIFTQRNKKTWFPLYGIGKYHPKQNNFICIYR